MKAISAVLAAIALFAVGPASARFSLVPDLPDIQGLSLAFECFQSGQPALAESLATQLLESSRPLEPGDSLGLANLHLLRARCIYDLGRVCTDPRAEASALAAQRLLEAKLDPNDRRLAYPLGMLIDVYGHQYRLDDQRFACEQRLHVLESQATRDPMDIASTLNKLGGLCQRLGDLELAERYFLDALAIRDSLSGGTGNLVAASLNNLANVHHQRGDLQKARSLHQRALELRIEHYGPDHFEVGQSRSNLAEVLLTLGQIKEARLQAEQAIVAYSRSIRPDHWDLAYPYSNLAEIELADGKPEAALLAATVALELRLRGLGPDHPLVAESYLLLARVQWNMNDAGAALLSSSAGEDISRAHLRLTLQTLSEREGLLYARSRRKGIDMMLTIVGQTAALPHATVAWEALINQRCLVLDEMSARSRLQCDGLEATARFQELMAARRRLLAHMLGGVQGQDLQEYKNLTLELSSDADDAERSFARNSGEHLRGMRRSTVPIQVVQNALNNDEALLSYARYEPPTPMGEMKSAYVAFVLPAGSGQPTAIPLGAAVRIDSMARAWQEAAIAGNSTLDIFGANERTCRERGELLRQLIWDPVAASLGGPRRLFLVGDGELLTVPFAALPIAADRYLIETAPELCYLNSEADLLLPTAAEPGGVGILALGDPAFLDASSSSSVRPTQQKLPGTRAQNSTVQCLDDLSLAPIPATRMELNAILALWRADPRQCGGVDTGLELLGSQASEAGFRQHAPGKRLLHLATHAFVCGGAISSGLSLAPSNPLLLSGILLAGNCEAEHAATIENDGLLTAEEIALLDLASVECAVLSACSTGGGYYEPSEGLLGLRWAFQAAGVRSLVLCPWPVRDEWVQEWMVEYYDRLLSGAARPSEAARLASLAALENRRRQGRATPPAAWGAMMVVGASASGPDH